MNEKPLVVHGGVLIDGRSHQPIEDCVIVIERGRFTKVGTAKDILIPENANLINVGGKTVLPGFIDGHGHWEDFHGELYLNLGITTCATIMTSQDGPWTVAQREGTALGRIRGPRIWSSGRAIGGGVGEPDGGRSRASRGYIIVNTPDEARQAVIRKKERGLDIIKINEFISYDLVKAVADEAHRQQMAVAAHSWDVIESARAGVDSIEHIWSVGYSSILDVKRRRDLARQRLAGNIEQELAGALYEPENYQSIIDEMVKRGIAWTPTIAKWLRPLSPSASRFRQRENEILDDASAGLPPSVRAVTNNAYDKLFKRYSPAQLERTKIFYEKANEFIIRFAQAGGILKEGSDPPRGMAGLLMHEALVMDVEAGVSPMAAIQAATLNVAKTFKKDEDFGSVEPGKVADLSIVEGNPLKDIWATQSVRMVIMDGKCVELGFHKYSNPIPSFYAFQTLPKEIEIAPLKVVQGARLTELTVRGKGLWPFHQVFLNGAPIPTRYVNKSELKAAIPGSAIAEPGTYIVTVRAQGQSLPESNRAHLIVTFRD